MSLITKYRPSTLSEIYGNEESIKLIKKLFEKSVDDRPHSFLFTGQKGCGKTTLARIVANITEASMEHDFIEIDIGDHRGIDIARHIKKNINYPPLASKARVYLLDECHRLTKDAQEALLKTTEEPPLHSYLIYCTTNPEKLKSTLRDRCTIIKLKPLDSDKCLKLVRVIARKEKAKIPITILEKLVLHAEGRPRTALKLLERIIGIPEDKMEELITTDKDVEFKAIDLCRKIVSPQSSWKQIANVLVALEDEEPEKIRRMVLGYCSSIMLKRRDDLCFYVMDRFINPFYNNGRNDLIYAAYSAMNDIEEITGKSRK